MNVRTLMSPGIKAVSHNWRPIVLIQSLALIFVVLYYQVPAIQALPEWVNRARASFGILWTLGVAWLASIFIPEGAAALTMPGRARLTRKAVLLLMIYYGIIALVLEVFYAFMNQRIGSVTDFPTIAKKIFIDQFVFSPLVTMPFATVFFAWKDANFDFTKAKEILAKGGFWRRYFPILATCWMYFGPFTIALYSLPLGLQFPLAMAAQAGWSLIVLMVGSRNEPPATETA